MYPTSIEADLRSVVGAESGTPQLHELGPATQLDSLDFSVGPLLSRLGLGATGETATLGELAAMLEAQPAEVRRKLWERATEARLHRLLAAILVATRPQSPAGEAQRWWQELASQVLWWYARQSGGQGLRLAQRGMPARAAQSLAGLGLLDVETLAADRPENAAAFVDVLERLEYSGDAAVGAYTALKRIAAQVVRRYGGQVQGALRRHAGQLAEALSAELLSDFADPSTLKEPLRAWISVTTGLPIAVWSPSTVDFTAKFARAGVSAESLLRVADEAWLDPLTLDDALASFMESVCRNCDPEVEGQQLCVSRFAMGNWQVECPIRPDLAARALG